MIIRLVFSLLALLAGAAGQVVPGLYVVELTEDPATAVAAKGGRREAAEDSRQRLLTEQRTARQAIEAVRGEVLGSVNTVANALIVRFPDGSGPSFASIPQVSRVYPVLEVHLELDRAVELHRAPDAWRQLGGIEKAGLGAKIAIIDTGIDAEHPGFQDPTLKAPDGFPKASRESDLRFTNSKIIVARSYEDLLGPGEASAEDRIGHGTAVAMTAAGALHRGPFGPISGIAPKAFLGAYKVFHGSGGGTSRTDVILRAMDEAVADGMDVINLSLGSLPAPRPEDDVLVRAAERAAAAGVLVVTSAGNRGPEPRTLSSPNAAASIISVGATWNDRVLASTVTVGSTAPFLAIPGNGPSPTEPLQSNLVDVFQIDGTGLACGALPSGSLSGRIAFVLRGDCLFEEKLNIARAAGAIAAVLYTHGESPDPITMNVGVATLPAMMVSHADGLKIKTLLAEAGEPATALHFEGGAFPVDSNRVASLSSRGPHLGQSIKPDLLAVGVEVLTATQKNYPDGEVYSPVGYAVVDGTSFSSPLVAGAAAVLKAARPGLTQAQYRSLLIHSARALEREPGTPTPVQQAGTGALHLDAAVRNTIAASPVSLSFGAGGASVQANRDLIISNLGTAQDTFSIVADPIGSSGTPTVSDSTFALAPGASRRVELRWSHTALPPGEHQGFLRIQGTQTGVISRVPYWYAVTSQEPRHLTVLRAPSRGRAGDRQTIYFQVTDAAGIPLLSLDPTAEVVLGEGEILRVRPVDEQFPGVFEAVARLDIQPGNNTIRLRAGELSRQVQIRGVADLGN